MWGKNGIIEVVSFLIESGSFKNEIYIPFRGGFRGGVF
jgi:hypothetical protein